jgi:Uma2 family endonuclease
MSAATVGAEMPVQVTLDDLAAMAAADENHRYELSPEGVLSVMPPADPDHALLVRRILAWFLTNGYGPEQVVVDCGIDVGGGRVPDVSVWAEGKPPRRASSSYAGH